MDQRELVRRLAAIVGEGGVLGDAYDLMLYQYDASVDTALPEAVAFPTTAQEVSEIVKVARREGIPIVARGAGTGLSGGSIPAQGGIVIAFSRMNRILEVDAENRWALVEPGVVNWHLSQAVAGAGLYFVPDPASQKASTIGGNIAENSGGPHTLAYGATTNHVLGLEVVLPEGEIVWLGGPAPDAPGYDLVGLMVGTEGTLGLVTKALVRLVPLPEAVKTLLVIFNTIEDASNAVSSIIGHGIIPAALEMMDNPIIQAVEAATGAGYPLDAGAVLLIDIEGLREAIEDVAEAVGEICRRNRAREVRVAKTDQERELLWAGRKGAFGALGRIAPAFFLMDGVVPRTKLPQVLAQVAEVGWRYGLPVVNVFHAGDGNLHPIFPFDPDQPGVLAKVIAASREILELCVQAGGSITGEHGVGLEKREMMLLIFSAADLEAMQRVKEVFDPQNICNPGKVLPPVRQGLATT